MKFSKAIASVKLGSKLNTRALSSTSRLFDGSKYSKVLKLETINQNIVKAEYAVRGELALRYEQLAEDLKNGIKYPFSTVVSCNIGNPQALDQKPITFYRQVAALTEYPDLLKDESKLEGLFPKDVVARAKEYMANIKSIGAYSHSQGIPYIRKRVAKFIEKRDGFPSNPENIFLTTGASAGVQLGLQLIVNNPNVGIMIPIPQYPLYTATLAVYDAKPVPYYLDESNDWGLKIEDLKASLDKSRSQGIDVRALVIINPGNPTGQCLTFENMAEIVKFCHRERLVLMADEVYQANVYQPEQLPFHSFKKVLNSVPECKDLELISFHSISKGMIGECGRRGGYFELSGFDPAVKDQIYKMSSISLCTNVMGQIMVDLMLHPPQQGEASYDLFQHEYDGIYQSLKRRAKKLCTAFNQLEGVTCNDAQGSMYLFPQIRLPKKAIEAARKENKEPDAFYAMAMLNATGVCVIPGSGFEQVEGTYHFRSTFLPQEHLFDEFINSIQNFHKDFMKQYS